ncbi:hypothetical protein M125_2898, partial [Bacteroides fragilis str. 3998T(B)3]
MFFNEIKLLQFHSSALFLCYCRYRVDNTTIIKFLNVKQ